MQGRQVSGEMEFVSLFNLAACVIDKDYGRTWKEVDGGVSALTCRLERFFRFSTTKDSVQASTKQ